MIFISILNSIELRFLLLLLISSQGVIKKVLFDYLFIFLRLLRTEETWVLHYYGLLLALRTSS